MKSWSTKKWNILGLVFCFVKWRLGLRHFFLSKRWRKVFSALAPSFVRGDDVSCNHVLSKVLWGNDGSKMEAAIITIFTLYWLLAETVFQGLRFVRFSAFRGTKMARERERDEGQAA